MTESVIEALENRQQATGDAEIPDVSLRGTSPQTGDVAIRTPSGRAEESEETGDAENPDVSLRGTSPQTGDAAIRSPGGRAEESEETGDADCHSQCAHWLRNDRSETVRVPGPALSETEGNGRERVSSDADPAILAHLRSLHAQAEELRRDFPDFDLGEALRDPAFLRLTAPALGVGVREAYYALNRPRLDELAAARAAEESRALLARSVAEGARRPREGGGSGAAALLRSDYAALPRERQLALKQRIREAAARGEKMYP